MKKTIEEIKNKVKNAVQQYWSKEQLLELLDEPTQEQQEQQTQTKLF